MSRIFYSVQGEGRGHATRVRAVIEELRSNHEITVYASNQAYALLASVYHRSEVKVHRIPGFFNYYTSKTGLDYVRTGFYGLSFLAYLPRLIQELQHDIDSEKPDLAITDYEPALPRAAARCGIPFISLNHQHFLLTYDLSSLPSFLRRHAAFMAQIVRSCYSGQVETVVSSFYFPPLKSGVEKVTQIGVLLRPEIICADPSSGSHLVVYIRRNATQSLLDALQGAGCEVRIYGLGARPSMKNLRFHAVDAFRFVEDLASSRALICTAGNQLVGEALYLGKAVLAIPEKNNYEQYINAHFLQESGAGMTVELDDIASSHVRTFCDKLDIFGQKIDRKRQYGNPVAKAIIQKYLNKDMVDERSKISDSSRVEVTA